MARSSGIEVLPHDLAVIVDAEGGGELGSAREIDGGENALLVQQKAMGCSSVIVDSTHNLATVVDAGWVGYCGTRGVDRGKDTFVEHKPMEHSFGIEVAADDLVPIVDLVGRGSRGAWNIECGERILVEEKTTQRSGIDVAAHNLATVVDVGGRASREAEGICSRGAGDIDRSELTFVQ